jgi:hypothetical protein
MGWEEKFSSKIRHKTAACQNFGSNKCLEKLNLVFFFDKKCSS